MEPEARFKIDELAEATDLSRRTIHHYIAEGMIPRARGGAGPAAYYDEEHYLRLRLLARLKGMGLSLSTIRDSLNDLSLEEMRELLELPEEMDYRAMWAHIAMQRSGTPESFLVEEAELAEPPPDMALRRADRYPGNRRRRFWRRDSATAEPDADTALLRQHISPDFSLSGTIRRDPELFGGLADEPLHPEMDSQPWRRIRVSNDLEISYRPSSDPLTRKKLRHLLDFVHRLFRLERRTEGLTPEALSPEGWIAEERPTARRTPDHDSKSMHRPRTPGTSRTAGGSPQDKDEEP